MCVCVFDEPIPHEDQNRCEETFPLKLRSYHRNILNDKMNTKLSAIIILSLK